MTSHHEFDVVIGGIPRSGTTALARAIGKLHNCFMWDSETHIFPLLVELAGCVRSGTAYHFNRIEEYIFRRLSVSLLQMRQHQVIEFGLDNTVRFSERDIKALAHQLAAILSRSGDQPAYLNLIRNQLSETFAKLSPALHYGEKTPANLLVLDELRPHFSGCMFMIYRHPGEIIRSMARRAGSDAYDGEFAVSRLELVGHVFRYAQKLTGLPELGQFVEGQPRFFRLSYDKLVTDPIGTSAAISYLLEQELHRDDTSGVLNIVGQPGYRPAQNAQLGDGCLNAVEYLLLRNTIHDLGYEGCYPEYRTALFGSEAPPGIFPFFGLYPATDDTGRWCSKDFAFVVIAPKNCTHAQLNFWGGLQEYQASLSANSLAAFDLGSAQPEPIATWQWGAEAQFQSIIDLAQCVPFGTVGTSRVYAIRFACESSCIPYLIPGAGQDERLISVLLASTNLLP